MKTFYQSKKFVQVFAGLLLVALCMCSAWSHSRTKPPPGPNLTDPSTWRLSGPVQAKASLSQNKVLYGSDGLIYMQINIQPNEDKHRENPGTTTARKPTDYVVVLDRSGSMSGEKKMDYAHQAIASLIGQLKSSDRFALVTFDDQIEVPIELTSISRKNQYSVINTIRSISPRGSTNLGGGLIEGIRVANSASRYTQRAKRVILLSDGQANTGITDIEQLNHIASNAVGGEFAISTIGVGLDFNEQLLASLADFGTGSYYFLESLASLESVLSKEFYSSSRIVASNLELRLKLAPGIQVIDASGYPILYEKQARYATIRPGHLYQGQEKSIFVTLQLPTHTVYSNPLGKVELSYQSNDQNYFVSLIDNDVNTACLPKGQEKEVRASINQPVFEKVWTKNNYGRFLKDNADYVRSSDKEGALKGLQTFKAELNRAYEAAPAPGIKNKLAEVQSLEEEIHDAFTGSDQDKKQKHLSKTNHAVGTESQRYSK